MNEVYHLFVYGSLRKGFKNEAYSYLNQFFDIVGQGTTPGVLYDNVNYPVAKPSQLPGDYIVGELYAIKNPHELDYAFMQIDDYEGLFPDDGELPKYSREVTLVDINGIKVPAYVYWYKGDVSPLQRINAHDMLVYLEQRYGFH